MAYTILDIENRARALLGREPEQSEEAVLRGAAAAVCCELEAKLRPGAVSAELDELIVTAGGILTVAMLTELTGGAEGGLSYFKAGSLSARFNGSGSVTAAELRKSAEAMLAPYTDRGGFGFVGVAG